MYIVSYNLKRLLNGFPTPQTESEEIEEMVRT